MRLDIETTISVLLTQRYVDKPTLLQSVYFVNRFYGMTMNVSQVSQNWNQLVTELNTWLVFGKSLDKEVAPQPS